MSIKTMIGVVNLYGESNEVSGLYIADGSVLPTSLGINPMITIEAFAVLIADNIIEKLSSVRLPWE